MVTTTGECAPFRGSISAEFEMGSTKYCHEFLLADIKDDGILGLDFLEKNNCQLNLGQREITIGNEKLTCKIRSPTEQNSCCRIAV